MSQGFFYRTISSTKNSTKASLHPAGGDWWGCRTQQNADEGKMFVRSTFFLTWGSKQHPGERKRGQMLLGLDFYISRLFKTKFLPFLDWLIDDICLWQQLKDFVRTQTGLQDVSEGSEWIRIARQSLWHQANRVAECWPGAWDLSASMRKWNNMEPETRFTPFNRYSQSFAPIVCVESVALKSVRSCGASHSRSSSRSSACRLPT